MSYGGVNMCLVCSRERLHMSRIHHLIILPYSLGKEEKVGDGNSTVPQGSR
jgi:hypothetical protein